MKWVLVDKYDNINTSAELHSGYKDGILSWCKTIRRRRI